MEERKFYQVLVAFTNGNQTWLDEFNHLVLSEYGCNGIEEFSIDEPRVDEILGDRAYSGGDVPESLLDEVDLATKAEKVSYKYFFYEDDMEINTQLFLDKCEKEPKIYSCSIKQLPWCDWNTEWRKHYKEIIVSENLRVVPEWEKTEANCDDEGAIFIYPGMGFGTGEHETTYLCLKLYDNIRDNLLKNDFCLDLGCGSGILGIAAIKKSLMFVDFCDIDRDALNNCLQNLELNFAGKDLSGHRLVLRERFLAESKYSLVFANILEPILVSEKKVIDASLKRGGYLIVSGILNDQVKTILEYYDDYHTIELLSKNDWSAILLKKK